jgi:hypothetical protein
VFYNKWEVFEMLENLKTFIPLLVLSVIAIGATFGDGNFSTFAVGLSKYALAVGAAWFVDSYLIQEVKTREILASNPVAYAIWLFANILTAALCFANS